MKRSPASSGAPESTGAPLPAGSRPGKARDLFARAMVLTGAAILLWFALGMHRGVLLSNNIKALYLPWAPTYPERFLSGEVLTDPVWQFVPWLKLAKRELLAGRLPLWNPHQDGGVPLLGNFQSALGSPLVWPVLALGISPGWNLSLLLRLLLALAGTYLWLRECGRSRLAAGLGAGGFALSGPFVAWLEHPHSVTASAVPLLLFFSTRAARGASRKDILGVAAATYLVLSGGHPETQLMAALLIGAAVLVRTSRRSGGAAPLGGALLGAGLAAWLLLPFVEYFRLSAARAGADREPFTLPLSDLLRFLFPGLADSHPIEAAASVSVTLLLLALIGVWRAGRDREARFWAITAAVLLLVVYENPVSRFLAAHTSLYWTRALLLLPLPLVYLAAAALDAIRARGAEIGRRRWGVTLAVALAAASGLELLAAAQGTHSATSVEELSPVTPLLSKLRADSGVFRILAFDTFLPPNAATDYGLDDMRGYDALAPSGFRRRRGEIGRFFGKHTDVIQPWGLAPGGRALDFWNVKYLLLPPKFNFDVGTFNREKDLELAEIYAGPEGRVFQNRRVLPRARLSSAGPVRILERVPARWVLEVAAKDEDVLTIANPAYPGWRAQVDGQTIALGSLAGEAIRVPVPAGHHRVELFYRPLSFWLGAGVSLASGALILLLLVAGRRG